MKSTIHTESAPAAIGPYVQAVSSNGLLFVSGQLPIHPETGQIVDGGVAEQARQALTNALCVVEAAGLGKEAVVKATVFLTDLTHYAAFNEIYGQAFGESVPARSVVQVARLPRDADVEVELIASF